MRARRNCYEMLRSKNISKIIQSVYTSDNKENIIRLPRCTINEVIMLIETVLLKNSELMMKDISL